jgi:ArsR family transcriptional regulator, arsenate/arsenite/antimonite-responsive transcriptional repressor
MDSSPAHLENDPFRSLSPGSIDIDEHFVKYKNMKPAIAIQALAALAHPSRLELFRLLVRRGPEGYAAGGIAERLDIAGPTLSFHLKELSRAGLIEARRDGRFLYYSASMQRMNMLVEFLTESCCALGSTGAASCMPAAAARAKKTA